MRCDGQVMRCERCEQLIDPPARAVRLTVRGDRSLMARVLCPRCHKSFNEWWYRNERAAS